MKNYLPYGTKAGYFGKAKKCCANHPVVTFLIIAIIVAAIAFAIAAIVKLVQKEEDILDEEWDLDDDDEVYFYPSEEDFVEGE